MHPEDRLDALLIALRQPERGQPGRHLESWRAPAGPLGPRDLASADADLAPLLEAAQALDPLRTAQPDPRFARALQARILARAADRRAEYVVPLTPARHWASHWASHWQPLRTAIVAAAVLLALGIGMLTVAATDAAPGSLLFGLHRFEQGVQAAAAPDPAGRARVHLQNARQWLAAVRVAARQRQGDPAYSDALSALRDEDAAAAQQIGLMPAGATRAELTTELGQLRADEGTTLRAALPALGWSDRLNTTQALAALNVAVPHVAQATLSPHEDTWHVVVTGSGFQPGATLLLNGRPAVPLSVASDGRATAELPRSALASPPASVGVGNPDGTAAVTTNLRVLSSPAAGPSATETPGEHGGHGTPEPGDGNGNGTGQATFTPGSTEHEGQSTPGATPAWGDH